MRSDQDFDQKQYHNYQSDEITDSQFAFQKYISPPNPITTKTLQNTLQIPPVNNSFKRYYLKPISYQQKQDFELSLQNFYSKEILIYQRFQNYGLNTRNQQQYASSVFLDDANLYYEKVHKIGTIVEDQFVQFNSEFEGANLFQAFKTGQRQYDLVLQNDLNTTGYAQWFNFKVKNKAKNILIKFNIVNLVLLFLFKYKKSSLYQKGMKPLAYSAYDKKWQRNTFQVEYYENEIPTERQKKCYYTLSFCYEFKYQNDEVQFSHFYPYTTSDLQNFLSNINGSSKIKIKNLGMSSLRKPIPLIHLSLPTPANMKSKKVIVIIGRQHSGETQSSFLIQEIVQNFLAPSPQSEFLLEKFDIYICPMLNIDGVFMGNYRTNAYGYDLNRYWHTQNQLKIPEIFYFKKFINQLKKRHRISLILDLHGHSKKLNSFFYGNPYGKNYMMFPYVASKICQMIRFKSCSFHEEKSEKSKTARAVLGTLLKDTAYIYTFEVSFWGHRKNNRVLSYGFQDLKRLGKSLLSTIYKVFMEEIKEEITLKESIFFKQINKELTSLGENYFQNQSGSDSEAYQLTVKEDIEKLSSHLNHESRKVRSIKSNQSYNRTKQMGIQVDLFVDEGFNLKSSQVLIYSKQQALNEQKTVPQTKRKSKSSYVELSNTKSGLKFDCSSKSNSLFVNRQSAKRQQQAFYHLAYDNNYQTKQNFYFHHNTNHLSTNTRKHFLLQKLRIFGETFTQISAQDTHSVKKTKKSMQVQVPDLDEAKKQFVLDSIIATQGKFVNSEIEKKKMYEIQKQKRNISKNRRQLKKSFDKNNIKSLILNKAGMQDAMLYNQRSNRNFDEVPSPKRNESISSQKISQNHLNKNSFIIRVSKQPLVRIQKLKKFQSPAKQQSQHRQQSIYQNIRRLKGNITSLKRIYSQRLPEIQSSLTQRI